ncbi:MAG: hypothetical protein MJA31_20545 [Clostridia bacterium]|nr:hypothetical protein [Clostridia bacterium]
MITILVSVSLFIGLCLITYHQSPRYSYKKARDLVVNNLSREYESVRVIDVEIKKIKATQKLNYFIDKGYLIGVQKNNNIDFYFFNALNGQYQLMKDYKLEEN